MKKNMIKNVLAVSVVAAMAISCAACSETTETSAETEETVVETTVEETVAETTAEETVAETVAETEAAPETEPVIELDGEIDEDLIGSWTMEEEGTVVTYTFNDDNTGVVAMSDGEDSIEFEIAYSADGETLTVVMIDMGTEEDTAEYTIDGDTLSLLTEGEQTMDLTRVA
jgi:spermidine/putrescine-binding protein